VDEQPPQHLGCSVSAAADDGGLELLGHDSQLLIRA
jgi:hypothetical protein